MAKAMKPAVKTAKAPPKVTRKASSPKKTPDEKTHHREEARREEIGRTSSNAVRGVACDARARFLRGPVVGHCDVVAHRGCWGLNNEYGSGRRKRAAVPLSIAV